VARQLVNAEKTLQNWKFYSLATTLLQPTRDIYQCVFRPHWDDIMLDLLHRKPNGTALPKKIDQPGFEFSAEL
jgi:hypothetical protein